ncbi:divergent PAP2 family protein [Butyrivibrio sp. NC2002]|uniref:divergent PAP2 family protein n=1 Tax=Butyrivibrio sp. NC2002 TaxID=1410610 RepID=UPI0005675760|nr:divergent PAP2 family protein [Butyrivibrio sp. NC2002]
MHIFWNQISNNIILIAAAWGWISAQILKTILYVVVNKEFVLERLFGDGGMPSSHSATVMATVTAVANVCGGQSPEFAIALIFAIIVMHDAMGVRRETGKQAIAINNMMEYFEELGKQPTDVQLKEFVGHTPSQVVIGAILGVIVGIVVCAIL